MLVIDIKRTLYSSPVVNCYSSFRALVNHTRSLEARRELRSLDHKQTASVLVVEEL